MSGGEEKLSKDEVSRVEEVFTLPELMDALEVDFPDLMESTLSELYEDRCEDIRELLEDM